jgi:quercetin dioxygenase-like cupin family protein
MTSLPTRYVPSDSLSNVVECFWCLPRSVVRHEQKPILPDGSVDMIVSLGDSGPEVVLAGVTSKPKAPGSADRGERLGVSFVAGAASTVLGISAHESQTEDFTVLRGVLDLGVIDGRRVVLKPGDTFHLPAGVYHRPVNVGDDDLELEAVLTPGLESSNLFTDFSAVAVKHSGMGRFAGLSIVAERYAEMISFKPPVRMLMAVAAAMGRLFGMTLPATQASEAEMLPLEKRCTTK